MKEQFSQIIEDLGKLLEIELNLDPNNSCDILVEETISIQIEENDQDEVVIGSFLGELDAGRFREEALHNALITNTLSHEGVFAYNEPNNQLTYFTLLPIKDLTAIRLQETLAAFSVVALNWHEAIQKKEIVSLVKPTASTAQNPFLNP